MPYQKKKQVKFIKNVYFTIIKKHLYSCTPHKIPFDYIL